MIIFRLRHPRIGYYIYIYVHGEIPDSNIRNSTHVRSLGKPLLKVSTSIPPVRSLPPLHRRAIDLSRILSARSLPLPSPPALLLLILYEGGQTQVSRRRRRRPRWARASERAPSQAPEISNANAEEVEPSLPLPPLPSAEFTIAHPGA